MDRVDNPRLRQRVGQVRRVAPSDRFAKRLPREVSMRIRTLLLLLGVVVLAAFTILNWTAFTEPTTLSLVFTSVQAPLGMVMLVITGVLAAVFLLYVVYLQGTVILEGRRSARELQSQRQLADQAEASRFTELRTTLEARLDRLHHDLHAVVEQTGTVLTSYIAEVEDRLERKIGR
jgi:hypothetical protein